MEELSMMTHSTEELLDTFKGMSLLELSEFVKEFEKAFGVTATAPAVMTDQLSYEPAEEAEEQDAFTVALTAIGAKKINVIKEVRALASLGLKDAKDKVEQDLPITILDGVTREKAEKAKAQLEEAGASVTVS
jgi:large subunit ribosomal protein L7/L12